MAARAQDWFRQAEADLRAARDLREAKHYDWTAFASQQAAEKAIKALFQHLHLDAWGHVLSELLANLPDQSTPSHHLIERAKELDKHYIPTRYPNGFERGAPVDFYRTRKQAMRSQTRRQSLSSVEIKSVDALEVRRQMNEYAGALLASHPEVEELIVFGSFANGTYAPGSDLDVFIVLREATGSPRDRMMHFRPEKFPVPVDTFAFTRAEMDELSGSPIVSAVAQSNWRYRR
jgi:HEPN domain-containing protein